MSADAPICLVEPQLDGLLHAAVNAAMLHSTALAYPDARLTLFAFAKHLAAVQDILSRHAPELMLRVTWSEIEGTGQGSLFERWRFSNRLLDDLLRRRERLMFLSISRMQLMLLQRKMRTHDQVRAVLHGELDQLESTAPAERFPKSLFHLPKLLERPQPRGLRYILLSRAIYDCIPQRYAAAFVNACIVDHPDELPPMKYARFEAPVFGVFGQSGDGKKLEAIARAVKGMDPNVRIMLNGFVENDAAVQRLSGLVEGVSATPIPRAEYLARIEAISHALWLAPPDSYRLRASGTFVDAMSFGKPVIFSGAAFPDYYYAQEPGIGVRCATLDDVPRAIIDTARSYNAATYAVQQQAVARLRELFSPVTHAQRLRTGLDWDDAGGTHA